MQKVTGTAGGGLGTRCWFHDDDDDDDEEEDDPHHHHHHHLNDNNDNEADFSLSSMPRCHNSHSKSLL